MAELPPNTRNRLQRTAAYREALDAALKAVDDRFRADIDRCRAEESALIAEVRDKAAEWGREMAALEQRQRDAQHVDMERYRVLHLLTIKHEDEKEKARQKATEEINAQYPDVEHRRAG